MKNERLLPLFALTFVSVMFVSGLLWVQAAIHTPLQMQQHPLASVHSSLTVTSVRNSVPDTKRVNINTATAEQLQTLPGIGPVLAKRIIAYRREHGPFGSVAELINISGIGEKKLESIWDLITTGG